MIFRSSRSSYRSSSDTWSPVFRPATGGRSSGALAALVQVVRFVSLVPRDSRDPRWDLRDVGRAQLRQLLVSEAHVLVMISACLASLWGPRHGCSPSIA